MLGGVWCLRRGGRGGRGWGWGGIFECRGCDLGRGEGDWIFVCMRVSVAVVSSDSQVDLVDRKFNC